jgi:hypothetical protein
VVTTHYFSRAKQPEHEADDSTTSNAGFLLGMVLRHRENCILYLFFIASSMAALLLFCLLSAYWLLK